VLEAVQKRLDQNPLAMRQRRETAEHPFGTLKMRMGATHFLMKRLPKVATEMALHVLAYNDCESAGKRSDFFPAEFLHSGLGLRLRGILALRAASPHHTGAATTYGPRAESPFIW
jgi:hypothetical protein